MSIHPPAQETAARPVNGSGASHGPATANSGPPEVVLETALEPVATPLGYEIIAVELVGRGRGRIVRVYLDHANGVTLDSCTRMGRLFSAALDAAEESATGPDGAAVRAVLSEPYTLEVSSPGIERLLVKRHHFERFIGARVVVRTHAPLPGAEGAAARQRKFHGHIAAVAADPAAPDDARRGVVHLRGLDGQPDVEIPLVAIRKANLVYEG